VSVTRPLAGLAACALLLSGCGMAGTDWHPGVAAEVGNETITTDHVDTVATEYCSAIEDQLTQSGDVLPLSYLREGVTQQLVMVSAARQLGAQYGVGAGDQYTRHVAQLEQAVAQLPKAAQAAVIEIESSQTYVDGILQAVGEGLAQGTTKPTPDEAKAAGTKALATWFDANGVDIDPKFGVEIVDGAPTPVDTDISLAVGDTAKLAAKKTPDPTYSKTLPDVLRCG
jgi:peptidyl-prolyl cis-trans isomerase SurA